MRRSAVILLLSLVVLAGMLVGCRELIMWFAMMSPPKPVPAEFEMPEDQTILVLVDAPYQQTGGMPVAAELTRALNDQLTDPEIEIAKATVPYEKLMALAANTPNFFQLSVMEVGQLTRADLVLNVVVSQFQLKEVPSDEIYEGKMAVLVKVIETRDGLKLWPKELPSGRELSVYREQEHAPYPLKDFNERYTRSLCEEMADKVAKLFYEHPGREHIELPEKGPGQPGL
jgi:hypothetical protein